MPTIWPPICVVGVLPVRPASGQTVGQPEAGQSCGHHGTAPSNHAEEQGEVKLGERVVMGKSNWGEGGDGEVKLGERVVMGKSNWGRGW